MNNQKSLVNLLGLFLLLSTILIFGASKLFTLEEFIPLRGEEFMKLFSPFAFAVYFVLLFTSIETPLKKKLTIQALALLGIILMAQGIAMNQTANYFNLEYKDQVSEEAYDAIYFYDEYLGHGLAIAGLIILMGLFVIISVYKSTKKFKPTWETYLSGLLTGIVLFAMVIESQMAYIFLPTVGAIFSYIIYKLSTTKEKLPQNGLLAALTFAFCLSIIFVLAWGIYHGEFTEFSELGWI